MKIDWMLVLIATLLATTLLLFIVDVFPYPFGVLILLILLLARIAVLSGR